MRSLRTALLYLLSALFVIRAVSPNDAGNSSAQSSSESLEELETETTTEDQRLLFQIVTTDIHRSCDAMRTIANTSLGLLAVQIATYAYAHDHLNTSPPADLVAPTAAFAVTGLTLVLSLISPRDAPSAETAFVTAFRALPSETLTEITTALDGPRARNAQCQRWCDGLYLGSVGVTIIWVLELIGHLR